LHIYQDESEGDTSFFARETHFFEIVCGNLV